MILFVKSLPPIISEEMKRRFEQLTLNDLLEKLSDCTMQYSRMYSMGGKETDFYQVRRQILELQQEIVRRKEVEDDDLYDNESDHYPINRRPD